MQVLTDQIEAARSGVVIYGIGDESHAQSTSGHNEDDTPGVKAEDQDADAKKEHRAIDVMVGPNFSHNDAAALVADMTAHAPNRNRLIYINYLDTQWHRKNNWLPMPNGDDPHPTHVHLSGEADADENTTPWILGPWTISEVGMFPVCVEDENSQMAAWIQFMLLWGDEKALPTRGVDGVYSDETADALLARGIATRNNGRTFEGQEARGLFEWCIRVAIEKAQASITETPEFKAALEAAVAAEVAKITQAHTHTFDPIASESGPAVYQ